MSQCLKCKLNSNVSKCGSKFNKPAKVEKVEIEVKEEVKKPSKYNSKSFFDDEIENEED